LQHFHLNLYTNFVFEVSVKKTLVLAALSFGLIAAAPASAGEINFVGVGTHASVVSISGAGGPKTVWAGELDWTWLNPAGGGAFYSYCADVLNFLNDPQLVTVRSTDDMSNSPLDRGDKAAWLFNTYAEGIRSSADSVDSDTKAAALQVAIWEVLSDFNPNLGADGFILNTSGAIMTQANIYLSQLFKGQTLGAVGFNSSLYNTGTAVWLDSYSLTGGPGQDQITRVPEPATLLLMGLGGATLFRNRRRLNAKN
jgi:PEP-CTERM motif-containing protein